MGIKPLELKNCVWDEKLSLMLIRRMLRRMAYGPALYQKGGTQGFIWMCGVQ